MRNKTKQKGKEFRRIFRSQEYWIRRKLGLTLGWYRCIETNAPINIPLLNCAMPVQLTMANGHHINCAAFGSIQNGLISYRPVDRRPDCTALVGGIRLGLIREVELLK